uniref:CXXC motif containing zinc binding protein isoform X4 n=1 Tax=Myxine glutinosa TaxID=7769 RepID=UPI00358F5018
MRIALQFQAMLENLTKLVPQGEDFRWYLKLKCSHCGEDSGKWHYLTVEESTPLKGGRGSASLVQRCHLCQRESSIDIIRESIKPYCAEDSEQFRTMVMFECRGLEPTAFSPRGGFVAEGAKSGTPFLDVNLLEGDWTEYDERASQSVGVYDVKHRFIKA